MDTNKTGLLIRALRTEREMTQSTLAARLNVTEQAVSKWERGQGCPDVSLLPQLAQILGVTVENLLNGTPDEPTPNSGSTRNIRFYVCPRCGNLLTSLGPALLSCCGRTLEPLKAQKADESHLLTSDPVEDEWFLTTGHSMEKGHHITFVALVTGDRISLVRCWPEWDLQVRLPRRGHGVLFWHCNRHGLFRQVL